MTPSASPHTALDQNALKAQVAQAAIAFVEPGAIIGVGTGSTVNHFIDALGHMPERIRAAVSSSELSTARLQALGIEVVPAHTVDRLAVYVDGADEITPQGFMIKGGGAALTREKIVAELAERFVCIVDESKCVPCLGAFPLPVEVVPMAAAQIMRAFAAMGADATLRRRADGAPIVTDNAQHIVDVRGLRITDPVALEAQISAWPGVLTVGIFARRAADVALIGTAQGVQKQVFGSY